MRIVSSLPFFLQFFFEQKWQKIEIFPFWPLYLEVVYHFCISTVFPRDFERLSFRLDQE